MLKKPEEYRCSVCGHDEYKHIDVVNHFERYAITRKVSGLVKVVKRRECRVWERVSKEIAECSRCSNHDILSEKTETIPKPKKSENDANLRQVRFDRDVQTGFLNPGRL